MKVKKIDLKKERKKLIYEIAVAMRANNNDKLEVLNKKLEAIEAQMKREGLS